jgi:hypothetical protein
MGMDNIAHVDSTTVQNPEGVMNVHLTLGQAKKIFSLSSPPAPIFGAVR